MEYDLFISYTENLKFFNVGINRWSFLKKLYNHQGRTANLLYYKDDHLEFESNDQVLWYKIVYSYLLGYLLNMNFKLNFR